MECCPPFIVIGLIMDVLHVMPRNTLHCWNKVVSVQKISMNIYVKVNCNQFQRFLFAISLPCIVINVPRS